MASREFSESGKRMLARQKRAITRYLAVKAKPESCEKLLEIDRTLLTGTYEFFPKKNSETTTALFHCKISGGRLVEQIEVTKPEADETR
jgi:hypothetical protein